MPQFAIVDDVTPIVSSGTSTFDLLVLGSSGKLDVIDIDALTADAAPDGAADYVMTYDADAGSHKKVLLDDLPTGASLTNFTESGHTASPNNTVNFSRLLTNQASTNAGIALSPKGTGPITAHVPDSTATGGNVRGTNTVDLQTNRSAASEVASGNNSVLSGGRGNTVSVSDAFIGGGALNSVAGNGNGGVACGNSNTTNGEAGIVSGGVSNLCNGDRSSIPGGDRAKTDKYGQFAHASGQFAAQGDAQHSILIYRVSTTNATETELFLDGSSVRATVPASRTWAFRGKVASRQTAGTAGTVGDSAWWTISGAIKRDGSNNTTLVGAVTKTAETNDAGAAAWDITITADDTNESLKITFTGEADKTVHTVAVVDIVEVG